jgi:ribosomal protein L11 methyltransferase
LHRLHDRRLVTKSWTQIDITGGVETCDILAVELAELFGVSVEFIPGGIRLYLDSVRFAAEQERLRQIVESVRSPAAQERIGLTISEIPDEDWSQTWKAHFKPLWIGRRFLVSPTWEKIPRDPERLVILIDPGRAFGTGHHETTSLCLEWLENFLQLDCNSWSLLDVGTGSGILAIGAALLGFGKVLGIDNDPEAIEVARENIAVNGLSEKIQLQCATPEEVTGRFDVIISNIQSNPLIRMSEAIASKVSPRGRLALSGILIEQADEVRAEYEKKGLRPTGAKSAGEWILLAFEK